MTPEQLVAIIGAVTALLIALAGVFAQLRQTHALVNSRMTELIEVTKKASRAEGVLAEKEDARQGEPGGR